MNEVPIDFAEKKTMQDAIAPRLCIITLELAPAQALDRLQQLKNQGVEVALVRLRDWRVERALE
jgi:predicted RNA-binding protein YlxR (DUF448 family)